MDRCVHAGMHTCMYVCMYVCMDGWMDGWMCKQPRGKGTPEYRDSVF